MIGVDVECNPVDDEWTRVYCVSGKIEWPMGYLLLFDTQRCLDGNDALDMHREWSARETKVAPITSKTLI